MKKISFIVFLLFLIFAAANSANAVSFGGHEYVVVFSNAITWSAASAELKTSYGDNWHLATITSEAEDEFIASLISSVHSPGDRNEYWVGGYQDLSATGEKWDWVNGEGTFWDDGATPLYSNFWGSEPNDGGEGKTENYLVLDYRIGSPSAWAWNDEGSAMCYIHGYIGESSPVPEPATMLLLGTGLVGLAGFGRKKFFKK